MVWVGGRTNSSLWCCTCTYIVAYCMSECAYCWMSFFLSVSMCATFNKLCCFGINNLLSLHQCITHQISRAYGELTPYLQQHQKSNNSRVNRAMPLFSFHIINKSWCARTIIITGIMWNVKMPMSSLTYAIKVL